MLEVAKALLEPQAAEAERLEGGYAHYRRVVDALEGAWEPPAAA